MNYESTTSAAAGHFVDIGVHVPAGYPAEASLAPLVSASRDRLIAFHKNYGRYLHIPGPGRIFVSLFFCL